ncbi:uncharacterized protein UBRO2_05155 [Ustilago bromivora]|uniref:Uncharacterized protein n=1 Tax=Ustilago bromivora TaxID=307758 RepID=A0A8H8QS95_9BASI|nr:uncharacterized protein UBRO2_05155 [Ustilago bromivora]
MFGRSGSSPLFADLNREAQASTSSDVRADPDQSKEKAIVGLEALRSPSLKLVLRPKFLQNRPEGGYLGAWHVGSADQEGCKSLFLHGFYPSDVQDFDAVAQHPRANTERYRVWRNRRKHWNRESSFRLKFERIETQYGENQIDNLSVNMSPTLRRRRLVKTIRHPDDERLMLQHDLSHTRMYQHTRPVLTVWKLGQFIQGKRLLIAKGFYDMTGEEWNRMTPGTIPGLYSFFSYSTFTVREEFERALSRFTPLAARSSHQLAGRASFLADAGTSSRSSNPSIWQPLHPSWALHGGARSAHAFPPTYPPELHYRPILAEHGFSLGSAPSVPNQSGMFQHVQPQATTAAEGSLAHARWLFTPDYGAQEAPPDIELPGASSPPRPPNEETAAHPAPHIKFMKPVSARYTLVIEPGDEVNALITSMRNRIAGNVPAVAGSAPLSEQKLVELQPTISEDMDKVAIRILWHRTRAKAVFLQGQHGPRSFLLTHIVYPDFASSLDAYGYVGVWELDPAHGDEKGIMYLRGFFDFSELEFHAIDEHPEFTHRRYWVTARRGSKGYELRLRHMTVQRSKEEIELVQGPSVLRISDFPRDFLSALPDDPVCLMTSNVKQFDPVLSSPVANISLADGSPGGVLRPNIESSLLPEVGAKDVVPCFTDQADVYVGSCSWSPCWMYQGLENGYFQLYWDRHPDEGFSSLTNDL